MSGGFRPVRLEVYGRGRVLMDTDVVMLDDDNLVGGDDRLEKLYPNATIEFTKVIVDGGRQVVQITHK